MLVIARIAIITSIVITITITGFVIIISVIIVI